MEEYLKRNKVVLGIIEYNGKFILINRKRPHLHITWAFPGGIVHEGETDLDAVVREIKEEVGLDIEPQEKIAEWQHPNTRVWIAYYYCTLKPESLREPSVGEPDEILETKWVETQQIFDLFDPKAEVHPIVRTFISRFATNNKEMHRAKLQEHE